MKTVHSETLCEVENCPTKASSRGYCNLHYQRWYRHGDPLVVRPRGNPHTKSNTAIKSQRHSYQEVCLLSDIFPFLLDEEYMNEFNSD